MIALVEAAIGGARFDDPNVKLVLPIFPAGGAIFELDVVAAAGGPFLLATPNENVGADTALDGVLVA